MAGVLGDHGAVGVSQGVCERARVVHVGRCPVASLEQVEQQRTRRAVVTVHLVNERVAVIPAVVVDLAQPIVDPDVTGTDVVADGLRRGGRGKAEPQGERRGGESAEGGPGRWLFFTWERE